MTTHEESARRRSRLAPFLLVALVGAVVLVTTAAVAAYRSGTIDIAVREVTPGGSDVAIRMPAWVVSAALHAAPASIYPSLPAEVARHLPVVEAARRSLERIPDCTLVEVVSSEQTVRIQKRGDKLVVHVDGDDCTVRAALPLGTIATAARKLARRSAASL